MRHHRQTIVTLIGLALTVALGACSGPSGTAEPTQVGTKRPGAPVDLDGTEWVLTSLHGQSLIEGTNITLNFAGGVLSGFAGCNAYGGEYTAADEGILAIPELAITAQDCQEPEGVMQQEAAYVEALQDATAYRVTDGRLELENAEGETTLVFAQKEEFVVNPDDLLGTAWQLASLNGNPPIEGSRITLAFHNPHRVSGHAGCRDYVASYQANGDDVGFLSFAMMGSSESCSEALLTQEGEYTTVLGWASDYRLGEEPALSEPPGRLEILTARGEVLVFEPLPEGANASLEGTAWALLAFFEERAVEGMPAPLPMPADLLPDTEITATFEGGAMSGSAGCNTYRAAYTLSVPALDLGAAAATEMACGGPAGVMEQEQRYLRVLENVTTLRIYGHQLWLETDDGRGLVFAAKSAD
ncbi:MAG: META domain-containing protein [Anaerolineae bacterium]|nr:MAG: META domain-containing protein [Anaerolineae bacterium]